MKEWPVHERWRDWRRPHGKGVWRVVVRAREGSPEAADWFVEQAEYALRGTRNQRADVKTVLMKRTAGAQSLNKWIKNNVGG